MPGLYTHSFSPTLSHVCTWNERQTESITRFDTKMLLTVSLTHAHVIVLQFTALPGVSDLPNDYT